MYEEQLRQAITTIRQLRAELRDAKAGASVPIAVIGIGCRFPGGADSAESFADLLEAGTDTVVDTPPDRWDAEAWFDPDPDMPGRICTKRGAFLSGIDLFDAAFFEMSDREATEMDPQQRLLLITAWEALERAAIAPARLAGSRTGVYVGVNGAEYYQRGISDPALITAHTLSGGVASAAAGRIAYQFDLAGPAVAIDTACSSSLAAVHHACRALRNSEVDLALAGGVYAVLDPNLSVGLSRLRMLAPDGCCKPFDARANGFVQGEGAGMVALKRLDQAERDGDPILAVIRGTAMNQDGRSVSLTAPSRDAQKRVIAEALDDAGVAPGDIAYVETHGTGTALGDPIEAHALGDVFGGERNRLMLGAVKSNIGHLGPAAGVAGLVKTVEVLRRGIVPGNLHFGALNPQIDTGGLRFDLPTSSVPFPVAEGIRRAGISSFGFAGTNVHLVVESAPNRATAPAGGPHLLMLSARSATALETLRDRYVEFLGTGPDLASVCRSAALGRNGMDHRLAIVAETCDDAVQALAKATVHPPHRRARLAIAAAGDGADDVAVLAAVGLQPHVVVAPTGVSGGDIPVIGRGEAACGARLAQMKVTAIICRTRADLPPDLPDGIEILTIPGDCLRDRLALYGQLFALGFHLDPAGFTHPGPRIAVPVTPMEPRPTWRARGLPGPAVSALPGTDMSGPSAGARFRLITGLRRHPWLGDHRVAGQALVPGAFQIAMMMLAARHVRPGVAGLRNITFAHPLPLDETQDHEVWTLCDADGALRLCSEAGGRWIDHAEAEVMTQPTGFAAPFGVSLSGDAGKTDGAVWRRELAGLGIDVGPAFSGLVWLQRGEGQARASVHPVDGRILLDGTLHPAFLDACLQTAGGTLPEDLRDTALLPVGIDAFTLHERPDGPVIVEARGRRDGDTVHIDLTVLADDGRVLIAVEGLSVRPMAAPNAVRPVAACQLVDIEQHAVADPETRPRLIVVANAAIADAIRSSVSSLDQVVVADRDWSLKDVAQAAFVADATAGNDMLSQAARFARDVAGADTPPQTAFGVLGPPAAQTEALAGLAATLRMEQPACGARYVVADTAAALMTETVCRSDEDRVHIADGRRTVSRLHAVGIVANTPPDLSGAAIVSGGFGGLGRALAEWLATRGATALVLVGRHPDLAYAQELAARTGCTVTPVAADMSRPADIARIMASLTGLPGLQAVYHAAGAQAPGLLRDMTPARFAEAFDGKAAGAMALDRATRDHDLREFVLISSVAGILGAAGQGGYGAANAALDGVAMARRKDGRPALSLRLGRIADVGMARALSEDERSRVDALGLEAMPIPDILSGISAALCSDIACPVIADIDWRAFADRHPTGQTPPMLTDLVADAETARAPDMPGDMFLDAVRTIAAMPRAAVIDEDATLVQLGFDSLMAIELRTRLRKSFGTSPTIADILGGVSVGQLRASLVSEPAVEEWENLVL